MYQEGNKEELKLKAVNHERNYYLELMLLVLKIPYVSVACNNILVNNSKFHTLFEFFVELK